MGLTRPLTRSLTRPLTRSLSRFAVVLDPDAALLISDLRTAGATVSASQETIISDFIATEKAASRWDSLKRVYLPIWGVAAANAICWKTRLSGTFTATGVTHGAGFVQGDGSTGYMATGANPAGLGTTNASGSFSMLRYDTGLPGTNRYNGAADGGSGRFALGIDANEDCWFFHPTGAHFSGGGGNSLNASITCGSVTSTSSRFTLNRSQGGTNLKNYTNTDTAAAISQEIYLMARNSNGTPQFFDSSKYGAWHVGLALSVDDATAFTLNLKNIWESLTGLTLP